MLETTTMQVVSTSALRAGALRWSDGSSFWVTIVAKATYRLKPGTSPLSPATLPVNSADVFDASWSRGAHLPADFAPLRKRAEVTLVGFAVAPGQSPSRQVVTRLQVGAVDKSVAVYCDRRLLRDGTLSEGQPFTTMPTHFERAAGGAHTWNPVGINAQRDDHGSLVLPNLLPAHQPPSLDTPLPTTGYGPIAMSWPVRAERLRALQDSTFRDGMVIPADMDAAAFQSAMPDQQQAEPFAPDALIVLDNLVPHHERFVTQLVPVRPRAMFTGREQTENLAMRADALWIDSSTGVATLTFRTELLLRSHDEAGRVLIVLEGGEVQDVTATDPAEPPRELQARPGSLPFRAEAGAPPPAQPLLPQSGATRVFRAQDVSAAPTPPPPQPVVRSALTPPAEPLPSYLAKSTSEPAPTPHHEPRAQSALAASNAAADSSTPQRVALASRQAKPSDDERVPLELVWFDEAVDLRSTAKAKRELTSRVVDAPSPAANAVRALRALETTPRAELQRLVAEALRSASTSGEIFAVEGSLVPELARRDELEATIGMAQQFPTVDKSALDSAQAVLANEWSPPGSVDAALTRVREQLNRIARGELRVETAVRQLLLSRKRFREVTLLGSQRIVLKLVWDGTEPLPLYAPAAVRDRLPLIDVLPARLLVRAVPRQEQGESCNEALVPVAIARTFSR